VSRQSFCTFFDSNYAAQGLSLYYSLKKYADHNFSLYVLCLDDELFNRLQDMELANVTLISLQQIESVYPELLQAKSNRSLIEYYFTLSPVLPLYVLDKFKESIIASLDADILFFSSPAPIFDELGDRSIYIVPHRFRSYQADLLISGQFNVQCQLFRNDDVGKKCLHEWMQQCLEWCFDRYEDGKFADQKYLDSWPEKFKNHLVISKNLGVGIAPWNIQDEKISSINNEFFINDNKVIFYHFHGFKPFNQFVFKLGLSTYKASRSSNLLEMYRIYANELHRHGLWSKTKNIRSGGYSKFQLLLSAIKHQDLMINFYSSQ